MFCRNGSLVLKSSKNSWIPWIRFIGFSLLIFLEEKPRMKEIKNPFHWNLHILTYKRFSLAVTFVSKFLNKLFLVSDLMKDWRKLRITGCILMFLIDTSTLKGKLDFSSSIIRQLWVRVLHLTLDKMYINFAMPNQAIQRLLISGFVFFICGWEGYTSDFSNLHHYWNFNAPYVHLHKLSTRTWYTHCILVHLIGFSSTHTSRV